ncbi:MAG TPA: hypothetical protein VK858_03680 [Longimicrobiales bacterium]|nr:hypothetical protein [Longimicrobiales bacterium]
MNGRFAAGLVVLAVAVGTFTTLLTPPEVRSGQRYLDTDDYTRLLRVRELATGGSWFDATLERANWPDGDTLHWTRPMDVVLLAAVGVVAPIGGLDDGLRSAAIVVPPLLLFAILLVATWAAAPVGDPRLRFAVPVVLLAQPALVFYGRVGRADHHALILLCFAAALGFALRGLEEPERRSWAWGLGLSCALGLWTSTEFLLPLALFLATGMAVWVGQGGITGVFQRRWTGALAAGVAAALLLERAPDLGMAAYDRLSWVHLLVTALAAGVWVAATRIGTEADRSARGRAVVGLATAAGAGLVVWLAAPGFFGGPMVAVTDPVVRRWLSQVPELQPRLLPVDLTRAGVLVVVTGCAVAVTVWLAARVRRDGGGGRGLLLAGLVLFLGIALVQVRWVTYVGVLAGPAAAAVLAGRFRGVEAISPEPLAPRIAALGVLLLGPLVVGGAMVALAPDAPTDSLAEPPSSCDMEAVAAFLDPAGPLGPGPWTVAAHMDLGPVLLYRTPHRVLATPYHRNRHGIRAVYDLFTHTDGTTAADRARRLGAHFLVACPSRDRAFAPSAPGEGPTLLERLLAGDPPPGFRELPAPAALGAQRVWRVVEDP